jgi:glycosyltransferase involved in cell wall biosynthesis
VILNTQRRPHRLWYALASVGQQTHPMVETVVVNDGGPSVADVVERYRAVYGRPIHYVELPERCGLATARNAGVAAAAHNMIALLDDDDRFRPVHLMQTVHALLDSPGVVLAYDTVELQLETVTEDDGDPEVIATCRFGLPYDKALFDQDDFIVPSSIVFHREAFEAVGRFDEALLTTEDWDLFLRLRDCGHLLYVDGDIGVDYSLRLATGGNASSIFDVQRRAVLDLLSKRYGLPHLEPKTFRDVALDLGFTFTWVTRENASAKSPP